VRINGYGWVHLTGIAALVATFAVPPAANFAEKDLARIIVVHLPCAFATLVFLGFSVMAAFRVIRTQEPDADFRHGAALQITTLLTAFTLATGILFSKVQWGTWWQWDPRQTSFLLVMIMMLAGLGFRAAFTDASIRAQRSAAYTLATAFPNLFLILIYPRLPYVLKNSFHPTTTIKDGGFAPSYWLAILSTFTILVLAGVQLYKSRIQTQRLNQMVEEAHAELDAHRRGIAAGPLARPIPVSEEIHG